VYLPTNLDVPKLIVLFCKERRYLMGVTEATSESYKFSFRSLTPFLDGVDNNLAVKKAVLTMAAAGKKAVSINDRIRAWNAWLNWLHENQHTGERLRVAFLKEPEIVAPTLTREEIVRLVACRPWGLRERRVQAMAATILDTGLRVGELLDLVVQDIDLASLLVIVRKGKGRKGRTIRISPDGRKVLAPWVRDKPNTA
jgi:site-specific recombinase XerD